MASNAKMLTAIVKNGSPVWDIPSERARIFQELEGKRVEIEVQLASKRRSSQQNKYYWGTVIDIIYKRFIELGYRKIPLGNTGIEVTLTTKLVHEMMRDKFTEGSTKKLSTVEFNTYIENLQQFGAEMGVYIPDPEQKEL